jgi:hypothetical protein
VSGSSDCTVLRLGCSEWPAHRIKEVIKSSWDQVKPVAFSPDGKQIVSYSYQKWPCIWDVASDQFVESDDTISSTYNEFPLSIKQGWVCNAIDGSPLCWFPMGTFEDSVWSHSGTKVVMDNGKGLVTIIDMARFLRRDMSVTYISESQYGFA